MIALTRSRQDYLKALFLLGAGGGPVPTSRLAAHLQVSAPSVTNMIARLAADRLVSHSPRAGARLTPHGRREALRVVRRHRILETFLARVLGLDLSEVHEDAEILEHHISDRVLEAIDRLVDHPAEDPHGHPIPDAAGHLARRTLLPLSELARGARARVREIQDADARRLARWREIGLVPGTEVRVREVRPEEGIVELEVAGRRHVTGSAALSGVMVQVSRGGSHGV
jgi:DtxR family Mn-dependent transcriptional regulator